MKRFFKAIAILLLWVPILMIMVGTMTSCTPEKESNKTEDPLKFTVTFDSNGGSAVKSIDVENGGTVTKPKDPQRDGYEFKGWYADKDCTQIFDFTTPIIENITLYAKWDKITDYYLSMSGHLDHTFKTTLHTLLKNTHKTQLSYTPGVWDALKKIDEDPNNQENILCIYTGRSIPKANQDKGSSGTNIWNREHMWPNSHGFSSKDYAAYTDIHHLFASEKNINATRGNKDFNYVENGNSDSYGNKWNSTFFEPRDEVKGDIARAMFYMVVRYADPNELVLSLVNQTTSSSSNKTGQLGYLNVLLQWHKMDPVSEKEKQRNEIIYSLQGNRNPFIDYPDWVNLLYPNQ